MSVILTGKIIFVACNTNLVGAGVVRSFLLEDATVIFPANSGKTITMLKALMEDINTDKLVTLLTDYPDYDKAFDIVDAVMERFGKIDIFIICFDAPAAAKGLTETEITDWEKMIDRNITPFFVGARIVLSRMKAQGQGMLVNIIGMNNSGNGTVLPLAGLSAAIQAEMTKVLYREVQRFNIRCHNLLVVNLTAADTGNIPGPGENKEMTPAGIAGYIMKLYSCEAGDSENIFIWLPAKPGTGSINIQ